jgi:hypothetical protein
MTPEPIDGWEIRQHPNGAWYATKFGTHAWLDGGRTHVDGYLPSDAVIDKLRELESK